MSKVKEQGLEDIIELETIHFINPVQFGGKMAQTVAAGEAELEYIPSMGVVLMTPRSKDKPKVLVPISNARSMTELNRARYEAEQARKKAAEAARLAPKPVIPTKDDTYRPKPAGAQ